MLERGDGVWSLESDPPCTPSHHWALDSGPLSLLIGCIADSDPTHDVVLMVWARLGNLPAWWCYSCGAWGVER